MRGAGNRGEAELSSSTELTARIQRTYGKDLGELRAAVRSGSGRMRHRLGPVADTEDSTVKITLVAELAELGWFTAGPAPAGTCVTVSLAAHHEASGLPAKLLPLECEAWLKAFVGDSWMPHVYKCDCSAGPLSAHVMSYRVYLDDCQRPAAKPAEVRAEGCRPLSLA